MVGKVRKEENQKDRCRPETETVRLKFNLNINFFFSKMPFWSSLYTYIQATCNNNGPTKQRLGTNKLKLAIKLT